ncbi:MAG: tRNA/rRNA methyltransferase SpoU [Candidatus Paceibacter sp.]|jgi:TrmH family RNA methyltransferase|nr:tRNA/rRNA methyltransferase SpoU [Candidatus Paceibacter sp.]
MLTKATAKLIRELHDKKGRQEHGLFLVEGEKNVLELLDSNFEIQQLFVTADFEKEHKALVEAKPHLVVEQEELEKIGTLESNNAALAVVKQKENLSLSVEKNEIVLALDDVRDPGNLGTIIRIADWYGITKIICSPTTTDFYNPKTISATKGSFTRVNIFYTDLTEYLKNVSVPVFGAFLGGESVHTMQFPAEGILVMGSESHGIGEKLSELIKNKITIPAYGKAESLNVSIATAIILDNWKRGK